MHAQTVDTRLFFPPPQTFLLVEATLCCQFYYWSGVEVVQTEVIVHTSTIKQSLLKWNGPNCDVSTHDAIVFYYCHVTFWNYIDTANFLAAERMRLGWARQMEYKAQSDGVYKAQSKGGTSENTNKRHQTMTEAEQVYSCLPHRDTLQSVFGWIKVCIPWYLPARSSIFHICYCDLISMEFECYLVVRGHSSIPFHYSIAPFHSTNSWQPSAYTSSAHSPVQLHSDVLKPWAIDTYCTLW